MIDTMDLVGKTIGSWKISALIKFNKQEPIYQCVCKNCGFSHAVSKMNIVSNTVCPTCPQSKSPIADVIGLFGSLIGIDNNKRKDIDAAFEKLNQPEFKEIYSSLERASKSIKDVMNGSTGAPDIARKILEAEAENLKRAFNNLVEDGKITEEESRIFKKEINSTANIEKLKSVLEVMKRQQRETKKDKI